MLSDDRLAEVMERFDAEKMHAESIVYDAKALFYARASSLLMDTHDSEIDKFIDLAFRCALAFDAVQSQVFAVCDARRNPQPVATEAK